MTDRMTRLMGAWQHWRRRRALRSVGSMRQSKTLRLAVPAAMAAVAYLRWVRPWYLRVGATDEESRAPLPGDDLVDGPDLSATLAVTIRASAHQIWPWIAQMGQGRGGLYSYDALENLVGCDIHSADRIVPEWQDVAARRRVPPPPGGTASDRGRGARPVAGHPRRGTRGRHAASVRLHVVLRAPGGAGGDEAAGEGALSLHAVVGAVPRRTR